VDLKGQLSKNVNYCGYVIIHISNCIYNPNRYKITTLTITKLQPQSLPNYNLNYYQITTPIITKL